MKTKISRITGSNKPIADNTVEWLIFGFIVRQKDITIKTDPDLFVGEYQRFPIQKGNQAKEAESVTHYYATS